MFVEFKKTLFFVLLIACFTPWATAPLALLAGILYVAVFGFPFTFNVSTVSSKLLKIAIVGLGFGISASEILNIGVKGLLLSSGVVIFTLLTGLLFLRLFRLPLKAGILVVSGTAICGGSAIAAVSPIIKADSKDMGLSLSLVFLLNAVAIWLFPYLGMLLNMESVSFGYWSALAIHDTSSVLGAALVFDEKALEVATTTKLLRTLWIIPLSIGIWIWSKKQWPEKSGSRGKIAFPYFILFFILAVLMNSILTDGNQIFEQLSNVSRTLLVVVLFLIGTGINKKDFKMSNLSIIILGVALWVLLSTTSYFVITSF